ncbi:cell division topological specificity factor MinE [Paracoccus aestuariivivens]|uniref:Cell division topological specificity factor n=1 Tax=Paracoccus aestuariivivens TaxID=1820333 RepID=A0A6L6J5G9_9RHOB|nr:cell division topological specificity factor MinE [Paracoccus aestuariivivens]MTH77160.1 cell division topological specificity factor MinE [Paracoccus aestuariivivens]
MFGFSLRPRKPSPAATAKERLQILLAHERAGGASPEFLPLLQRDILEVVRRHMEIDGEQVEVKIERGDELSSLEINIELPGASKIKAKAG